jgi:hypothetical protein
MALILLVTAIMVATAFAQLVPLNDEDPPSETWGPVGAGEGMEPISITTDPTEDRFRALMPWPTNRTIYGIHWRPGGDYGLAVGSGGTLFKVTSSALEKVETGTQESIYDAAWKADGSEALLVGNHSTLFRWDGDAEDLEALEVPFDQRLLGVTWDGTGTYAIVVGDAGFVARFNGTGLETLVTGLVDFIYRVEWQPTGDHAIAVGDSGLLLTINTTEIVNSTRLNTSWGLWRLDWALDGSYAIIAGRNYNFITPKALVVRYNASGTFDEIPVPGDPTSGLRGVDFAPSGERAVISGENSTVLRWGGSTLTNLLAPGDRTVRACTWEGDTNTVLVGGNRGLVLRNDGSGWTNVSYDPRTFLHSIAWRPQGDYGLVVGRGGYIGKVSVSGSSEITSPVNVDLYDVDWSSDGSYALMCGEGGSVLRYNHGAAAATSIRTGVLALHGISIKAGENTALAVGDGGHVWLWSSGIWTDKKRTTDSRNLRDVAWRPDGAFAIIVGVSGSMLNFTGGQVETFSPQPLTFSPFFSVSWDKDSKRAMVVGSKDSTSSLDTIWVYNNRDWLQVNSNTGRNFYGCAFTADGEVGVAFGEPDYIVKFSTRVGDGFRSSFRSPYTIVQRAAMHPTGRVVYFAGSGGYAYRMDVGEFANNPPILVIAGPATGATFDVGTTVTLDATGSWDPDDDPLTFTWVSNITGVLAHGQVADVIVNEPGWHRIDLYVDDGKGHNVTDYVIIRFVVPNFPPLPVINSPLEGEVFTTEDVIVFDANGSIDPNGDPLTYHWVSNVSGDIGYAEHVEAGLRVGHHKVILWVEDDKGEKTATWVNVTVVQANRPPVAYITDPIENQRFSPDEIIEFNGSYSNDPDGDVLTFTWSSNLDGPLGTGDVVRKALSIGAHEVSLTVDDGHDHVVSVSIMVTVEEPVNLRPVVTLTSPESNTTVKGVVTITGLAFDPEGDVLDVMVAIVRPEDWVDVALDGTTWTFDWDTTELMNIQVSVFVSAYDGEHTTQIWAQYFIDNPPPANVIPTVSLVSPAEGVVDQNVLLEGLADDPDGDLVTRVEVQIDGGAWENAIGRNAWTFFWDTTSVNNGAHTVTIRSFDGEDYSETATFEFTVKNEAVDGGGNDGNLALYLVLAVIVVGGVAVAVFFLRGPRRSSPQ